MSFPTIPPLLVVPYVSVPEFQAAPTWLDLDDLIEGGTAAQQEAELYNQILKASAWADNYVQQSLKASYVVENLQCRVDRMGRIWVHPSYVPIRSISALSWGFDLWDMQPVTNFNTTPGSGAYSWIEDSKGVIVILSGLNSASGGPQIQFGGPPPATTQVYVQIEYVAGYGHGVLTEASSAGSSTLVVDDNMGFQAGFTSYAGNPYGASVARIWDPGNEEALTVEGVTGTTDLSFTSATLYNHQAGVNISELPAEVKQAVIQYACGLLLREDVSNDLPFPGSPGPSAANRRSESRGVAGGLITEAERLLSPYKRVR